MKILAIESSSLVASVAILEDDVILAEYTTNFKKTHSQTILPMLDEIVSMLEFDLKEIDAIAVCAGPGSFTGLRIGVASAKGLGLSLNKPLIAIPTLDATAFNMYKTKALIVPIMDARRNQVYTGTYSYENEFKVIENQRAMDMLELISELNDIDKEVVFLGDGVPVYKDIICENAKFKYSFAPPNSNRQRAASVASLGAIYYKENKIVESKDFEIDYLRKSQAEREQEAKQNKKLNKTS